MDDQEELNELTNIRRILAALLVLALVGGGAFVVSRAQETSAQRARERVRQVNEPYGH